MGGGGGGGQRACSPRNSLDFRPSGAVPGANFKCNDSVITTLHSVQLKSLDTHVAQHNVLTFVVVPKLPAIKPLALLGA